MPLYKKYIPLRGYTLSLADVKKIYQRLSTYVAEQGALEVRQLAKPDNMTQETFDQEKQSWLTNAYRIAVSINGTDGSSLVEDNDGAFTSPNLPAVIGNVFMTNVNSYEWVTRRKPANNFQLNIDFTMPSLFDSASAVSNPTLNYSHLRARPEVS